MDQELERLLKEVMNELKDLTRVLSGSSKSLIENTKHRKQEIAARAMAIKVLQNQKKLAKKRGELTKELNKEIDESIDALDKMQKKAKASAGVMGFVSKGFKFLKDATFAVGTAMAKTALALSDVTTKITGVEDLVNLGTNEIPYLGRVIQEVGKEIDSNVNVFTELSKIGASFGSSIIQLRAAQVEALMPLSKFMDLIGGNSTMLAKLFGSVSEGVPQITRLTKELRNITERDFAKFGLTLDDTSEYMMTYLELERARGNTERMSRRQLLDGTANYTKNLVILSKLTGQSIDQLNEQNMANAADGVMQSQLSKMSAKDAKMLTTNINSLPGPMRQFAKEMLFLGAPISDVSRDLEAMSQGKYGEAFKKFKEDLDPIAFQNAIKTIGKEVMDTAGAFGKANLAGGGFGEALNIVAQTLGTAIDPEKIKNETEARGDNIVSLRNLTSQLDVTKTEFERMRFDIAKSLLYDPDSVVDVGGQLARHLKTINEGPLKRFGDKIEGFGQWIGGKDAKDIKEPVDNKNKSGWNFSWGGADNVSSADGWQGFADSFTTNKEKMIEHYKPNKAFGGPIDSNRLTLVGEKGPEIITSNTVGTVTANQDLEKLFNTQALENKMTTMVSELNNANKNLSNMISSVNTLVTIGTMTEKNTGNTKKTLENMSGTLV